MSFNREQLDKILAEVSEYKIELEEDPTLPHLGQPYVLKLVSTCRNYTNRVSYYSRQLSIQDREMRRELKLAELDLEFKLKDLLANNLVVRQQPNIRDREAVAHSLLRDESQAVADLMINISDLQEVIKIVKMVQRELGSTNQDIKAFRQMVRDDIILRRGGGDSGDVPRGQDKSVPGGMRAAVRKTIVDPQDLLDPEKRPDGMPEPKDRAHAQAMADFLNSGTDDNQEPNTASVKPAMGLYDDLLD